VIVDFSSVVGDKIQLDRNVFGDFDTVKAMMKQVGSDTVIELSYGNSITIRNTYVNGFSQYDFDFV
jgi:hypothetical protein